MADIVHRRHEFSLHEYDSLRKEIEGYFAEIRKLEVYAVFATGLVFSFLLNYERPTTFLSSAPDPKLIVAPGLQGPLLAWGMPIAFPILAYVRGRAFNKQILLIAAYLIKLEKGYNRANLGWEHDISDFRKKSKKKEQTILGKSTGIFMVCLFLFSVTVFTMKVSTVYPQASVEVLAWLHRGGFL